MKVLIGSLYEMDLNLWMSEAVECLRERRFDDLDIDNLIEEIESLAGRDRRELRSRLVTLYEHLLKRNFVDMPECFRGWETTIERSRIELKALLQQSPSLKNYLDDVVEECYADALAIVRIEYSHPFPNECSFAVDSKSLLMK
jgi:hypothetical protein